MRARLAAVAAVGALVLPLAACGADTPASSGSGDAPGADDGGPRELTVLAASSLTEVFTTLGRRFEAAHPGVTVTFAFDSSATLATQAAEGAPADVLATADERTMADAADADVLASPPRVVATNRLVLVTPPADPGDVSAIDDLDRQDVTYVVCVPTAPCGDLAARALGAAGVTRAPASQEVDVKAVLAKVTEDEADAGIVYATDAVAAGDEVREVDLPESRDLITTYPVAALDQAASPDLARDWIRLLTSAEGRAALTDAGFSAP